MDRRLYRFVQASIVLGLATYLAERWASGRLSYYINLRFALFTIIAVIGLAIMAGIGLAPLLAEQDPSATPRTKPVSSKGSAGPVAFSVLPVVIALLGLSSPLILVSFVLVIALGVRRLRQSPDPDPQAPRQSAEGSGAALILLAIPLILGILVPVRPLSTSALNTRGMSVSAPISVGQQSITTLQVAPDDRTVLDWIKVFNYEEDLSPYLGASANVIGFVYHDPRLVSGQFMVGRFAITCCVADAFAIGLPVNWPDSAGLKDNSWVNVKGTVDVLTIDEAKVPLIHAESVEPIQPPDQPYLYP